MAMLYREADMAEYLNDPEVHRVQIIAYLTSYSANEPGGEAAVLLNFFKEHLAKLDESERTAAGRK
ncbi:MAG: hypothetical protein EXS55_02235 [Candidatus Magasanikbacteria bacterium]|nr:hypothetical protein [Candidatus Magasanikbacteria bacterium]